MATATKQRPILFSGEMVRSILDGQKTQTRRVCNEMIPHEPHEVKDGVAWFFYGDGTYIVKCPYGRPGDRLWVRETFDIIDDPAAYEVDDQYRPPKHLTDTWHYLSKMIRRGPNGEQWVVDYKADDPNRNMDKVGKRKWRPSIHMPRWASRITLEVTEVRVERLRDISVEDVRAEGVEVDDIESAELDVAVFAELWDSLNGKTHPWSSNPWVWVITFERCTDAKTKY